MFKIWAAPVLGWFRSGLLWIRDALCLDCSRFRLVQIWDAQSFRCSGFRLLGVRDAPDLGCSGFRLVQVWNVPDSGCSRSGLDSGCSRFGLLWIWATVAFNTGHECVGADLQTVFCQLVVQGERPVETISSAWGKSVPF